MKRRTLIGGVAAAGVAVAAGVWRFTDLFVKHYPPTSYDDLLGQLTDRAQAAKLGAKLANAPDAQALAAQARASLQGKSLSDAANADIAAGHMVEVDGWVLPRTVALLSALAARV
jgi:hypothetical protein